MPSSKLLLFIFISFFKISLLVIGGGFAMIPVIEDTFSKKKNLLTSEDILDMIAVTQTMPGLVAVNSAIFVGQKLAGIKGELVAVIGVLLPSIIIISILAAMFSTLNFNNPHLLKAFSCVRACICAMFIVMAFKLGKNLFKSFFDYIIAFLFIIALFFKVSPVYIILSSIPIGCIYVALSKHKDSNE